MTYLNQCHTYIVMRATREQKPSGHPVDSLSERAAPSTLLQDESRAAGNSVCARNSGTETSWLCIYCDPGLFVTPQNVPLPTATSMDPVPTSGLQWMVKNTKISHLVWGDSSVGREVSAQPSDFSLIPRTHIEVGEREHTLQSCPLTSNMA